MARSCVRTNTQNQKIMYLNPRTGKMETEGPWGSEASQSDRLNQCLLGSVRPCLKNRLDDSSGVTPKASTHVHYSLTHTKEKSEARSHLQQEPLCATEISLQGCVSPAYERILSLPLSASREPASSLGSPSPPVAQVPQSLLPGPPL